MEILFLTSNASKAKLAAHRLSKYGVTVEQKNLPILEIQSMDVGEVARSKADQASKLTDKPFIIEDSAMHIHSLNNFPGTFLKQVFDSLGDEVITDLPNKRDGREATVVGHLVFGDPKKGVIKSFEGSYKGTLAKKPRGENLRGWRVSRVFIPEGYSKTLAEMDDNEWEKYLEDFRKNDHYEKFGTWVSKEYGLH